MMRVLFLLSLVVCATVFAQVAPPDAIVRNRVSNEAQMPGDAFGRGDRVPPGDAQAGGAELQKLLTAQTTAIKTLSIKVDLLDERVRKLEGGRR